MSHIDFYYLYKIFCNTDTNLVSKDVINKFVNNFCQKIIFLIYIYY